MLLCSNLSATSENQFQWEAFSEGQQWSAMLTFSHGGCLSVLFQAEQAPESSLLPTDIDAPGYCICWCAGYSSGNLLQITGKQVIAQAVTHEKQIAAWVWFQTLLQVQQKSKSVISVWFLGRSKADGCFKIFYLSFHRLRHLLTGTVSFASLWDCWLQKLCSQLQETTTLQGGTVLFIVKMSRAGSGTKTRLWRCPGILREDLKAWDLEIPLSPTQ